MKELSIERMELVSGGACSMGQMMAYAYLALDYAGTNGKLSFAYTLMLFDCMA